MDDLIKDFLVESYENLDRLDRDFVALESDPGGRDKLASIFRTIHTIKGTCGCLGLPKLESVAHVGENLLSRLRDGQLNMDAEITTALLKLVDAIREMLGRIEQTGSEGNGDYSAVCAELVRLNGRPSVDGAAAPAADPHHAPPGAATPADPVACLARVAAEAPPAAEPSPAAAPAVAEPHPAVEPHPTADAHAHDAHPDEHAAPAKTEKAGGGGAGGESLAGNAVRVDVVQLDKLMNLVGELVLTRNQVLQFLPAAATKDAGLLRAAQRLNLITTELQEGVMKTRMQPIGNLWNKFPRIVRDVANTCGKKVRLEMEGKDTELDRTVLEAIKDPLTHIIRNSVDHGVESPDKRRAKGKGDEGVLSMRAFHAGGQVVIEIVDDGAGINPERVKKKAVEKGLITAETALRMGEQEAINLIFAAGFSTAEKVTNVSGRGVGMDVVKTNVEKIGGTVDVSSVVDQGTTLKIKIPLTLAIIPALIVTAGGERFCIPQSSLLELVRADAASHGIERVHGAPVMRLRGALLPLVYLDRELGLARPDRPAADAPANIVVLRGGERQFGLVVDQVHDTEEIVVKPLGKQLSGIKVFAGATIMGDGQVALILDVMGVTQRAHLGQQAAKAIAAATTTATAATADDATDRRTLLLFKLHGERRMAIPLSSVARLEEVDPAAVERAGTGQVIQYRGEIMPLIDVAAVLGDRRRRPRAARPKADAEPAPAAAPVPAAPIHVVVYSHNGRNLGLRVEQILDTVNELVDVQTTAARPGVTGSAVIKDRVTEMLDLDALVRLADQLGHTTGPSPEPVPAAAA